MKLKKYFTVAVCAAVFLTVNVLAAEINVKINGTESTVSEAQSFATGLKPGENSITVTYSEKMKKEEKSVTTIAALYCNGALEDVDVSHSIPIGVGGQIPHSDFTLTLPEGIDDYFVKVFFFEDFSKILPLKNKGKETSGTDLAGNDILVDGNKIPVNTEKQEFSNPDWIHIEDNNGYVFLDEGEVTVQHTVEVQSNLIIVKDRTKNKSSNRVYPLLSDVREILLRIKAQQEEYKKMFGNCYIETEYVFARPDGKMYYPSYPSKLLKKILLKNNLKYIRFHDLRHSCVSMLIMKGWQMKDISDWLGHADITTTMNIYGHLSMEYKRKLGQQLENLL